MEGGAYVSPSWHPLLEANPFWPDAAARAAREDAQLLPSVVTRAQDQPVAQSVVSATSADERPSLPVEDGSFELHVGEQGQALTPVKRLYKDFCLAMSHLKFTSEDTDL